MNINQMNNSNDQIDNNTNINNNINQFNNNTNMVNNIYSNYNTNNQINTNTQSNIKINNGLNKEQNTMYTEWNKNTSNNSVEEKSYIVLSDEQLKQGKKNNNMLKILIYGIFFIVSGIVFYMYQIDKYEFYPAKNKILIANNSKYQVEMIPKNMSNFDYLNYRYEVEDKNIAEVNEYGEITAKNIGETNLKIKYKKGINYKTVKIKIEEIQVEKIEVKDDSGGKLQKGESIEVETIINNNEEIHKNLECRSSDENVLLVDEDCKTITPVEEGQASIIFEDPESEEQEEINYVVEQEEKEVESIELSNSKILIKIGTKGKIEAKALPEEAEDKNLTYTSNNENIEVDTEGNIYGKNVGTSVITIESSNGIKAYCTIEVEKESVQIENIKIKESEKEIKVGQSYKLGVEITPSNATERELTWTSYDTNIATVLDGKVIGKASGETIITAKTKSGKTSSSKIKVIPNIIQVESIEVKDKKVAIEIGSKYTIVSTINPNNATNKKLTYTSNNSNVTVDGTGVVNAKQIGKSIITISSLNGKKNSVEVEVVNKNIEPARIMLNQSTKEMNVGESSNLTVTIEPANTTVRTIKWVSSNKNVVSVVNGKLVAQNVGEADISATTINGLVAKCRVKVIVSVKSITISGESRVKLNTSSQYKAIIEPSNASDNTIDWISSDSSVAKINNQGLLTAKKVGITVLRAQSKNGIYGEKTINIIKETIPVKEVKINPETITIMENKTATLSVSINPNNATDQSITWSSSNIKVATVTSNGLVKGISQGEVIITAKAKNGVQSTRKVIVKAAEIIVEKITLNITNTTIYNGEKIELKGTIFPSNATNKSIKWTSSDKNIASVDETGKVIAGTKNGTATIIATTNNGKTAKCTILVKLKEKEVLVTRISLNKTSETINVGRTTTITATITPSNATNKTVVWTSSNSKVATIDQNGVVTGKGPGSVTITGKSNNGKTATATIKVIQPVTGISLNKTSATINVGGTTTIIATITPTNATNKNIIWTSSDTNIAIIDQNGKVTGKNVGTTTITAKSNNGKTATATITIKPIEVTGISLNITNKTINIGDIIEIKGTIKPDNATNKNITWMSSDKNIATIKNGKVTGKNAGIVTITAKSNNGKIATSTITINNKFQVPLRTSSGSILSGGDPFVKYYNGYYYYLATRGKDIKISISRNLYDIGRPEKTMTVYKNTSGHVIWAPELHYIQGRWYIYYTDVVGKDDYYDRRSFVLRAKTKDPLGEYEYMGQIKDSNHNYYAIDGTPLEWNGKLYFIYSGMPKKKKAGYQYLYIASMSNPWTLSSSRVEISRPSYSWEKKNANVNEGPEVLIKDGVLHIIYSANGAQSQYYCLGMLTYRGGNLLSKDSWKKSKNPVFKPGNGVYGVGHCSFTKSRDGKEDWIVYHAYENNKSSTINKYDRKIRIKKFTWNGTTPVFGTPDASDSYLTVPSGTT